MKTKLLTLTAVACLFVAAASYAQVPSYVPTNGLVGWWPFNGNANDESGNGNNGVVNGAISTTNRFGTSSSAYQFSSGNNITVNDNANLRLANTNFTVNSWVYLTDTLPNAVNYGQYAILSKRDISNTTYDYLFGVSAPSNTVSYGSGRPVFSTTNLTGGFAVAPSPITLNQWTSLSASYEITGGILKLYANGNLLTTANGVPPPSATVTANLWIGNDVSGQPYHFHGKLDDIGIWNRALTQQEITALYNATTCTKPEPVTLGTSATTERCPNDQVTIKVVTPAADPSLSYQWTRNGTNMVGATTRNITVADAAKYKVFVRSGPGVDCQRVSGLVETTAATPPTINATTPNGNAYCAGDSVLMSATGATAGYSYQWKRFGVPIVGATSPDFYAKQTGNYRCEVTNAGGCIAQSNLITIVSGTTCRVMQDQLSDVSVYPNPATNSFTVSFNDIGNEIPVSIELRNLQGQAVETRKLNGIADVQFNVGKLSPGVYMVRVMLESGDMVERSVVVE